MKRILTAWVVVGCLTFLLGNAKNVRADHRHGGGSRFSISIGTGGFGYGSRIGGSRGLAYGPRFGGHHGGYHDVPGGFGGFGGGYGRSVYGRGHSNVYSGSTFYRSGIIGYGPVYPVYPVYGGFSHSYCY